LPALEKIPASETPPPPAPTPGGTERVLLVEDEAVVRIVAAEALRRRGYKVFEAPTAVDAIHCWEQEQGKFDLLLTDLIMPGGVSGQSLADELRQRRANMKVIFTSGYSDEVVTRELRLVAGRNFLPKPYPIEELLAIVRQRLDGE
jgi:CheY-like chemotaxis protein